MKSLAIALGLSLVCAWCANSSAQMSDPAPSRVPPLTSGAIIDGSNAATYAAELPGALLYAVQHGLSIKIVPTERLEWPKAYQRLTEQYSPQARLDTREELQNYVGGLPFPSVSASDPHGAVKVALNWRWGPFIPEQVSFSGLAARAFSLSSASGITFAADPDHSDFRNELTCDQSVVQRTSHLAERANDPNLRGIDWEERADQCGPEQGKFIAIFYSEPDRLPDSYAYWQGARRWRRLAIPLAPNQSCTYSCTQLLMEYMPPKTDLYSVRISDERTIIGCMNGGSAIRDLGTQSFGPIACEPRKAYVLELIPQKHDSDLLRARVYIDAETFVYLAGEIYRDSSPDLSAAIWRKSPEQSDRLVLANDLYVPDDRAQTFMMLDLSQHQNFEARVSEEEFNPKAQQ